MKFSAKEDLNMPIADAFTAITDFEGFERSAMRRGADVARIDTGPIQVGSGWEVAFRFRGKRRDVKAIVTEIDPASGFTVESASDGLDALVVADLVSLSPSKTRLVFSIELTPKSLTARLLVQSLKLAKSNLQKRFKQRVSEYARDMEERRNGSVS